MQYKQYIQGFKKITAVLILMPCLLSAQEPLLVMGGEKGNYVLNPFKVASDKFPAGNVTGFKLERSADNGATFATISTFRTPQSLPEYKDNLQAAVNKSVFRPEISENDILQCWLKFSRSHKLDSIRDYLNYQHVLIAFNLMVPDLEAEPGKAYRYRLSSTDKDGNVVESKTSAPVQHPATMTYDVPRFSAWEVNQQKLTLTFKVKKTGKKPNHFAIYRKLTSSLQPFEKIDISRNFVSINDTLYFTYTDPNVTDAATYYYFIAPSDQYGNYNVHSDTTVATLFENKEVLVPVNFKAVPEDSSDALKLSWNLTNPHAIGTVELYRSTQYEGGYDMIQTFNPFETGYLDRGVQQGIKYYYYLKITDKLGRNSIDGARIFGIVSGTQMPVPVAVFIARATEQGTVMQWLPNGNDVRGFRIYRNSQTDGIAVPVGNFIPFDPKSEWYEYTDTVTQLPGNMVCGYTITQENHGHIEGQTYPWQYVRPLKMASMPFQLQVQAQDYGTTALVSWQNLMNTPFAGYYIYRRNNETKETMKLNRGMLPFNSLSYTDTLNAAPLQFSYEIEPVNINGTPAGRRESNEIRREETLLQAPHSLSFEKNGNTVVLRWEYYPDATITGFDIYSWQPDEEPAKIGSADKSQMSFTTAVPANAVSVNYAVKAVNKTAESNSSLPITIKP